MKLKWRPQVLVALLSLVTLGGLGIFYAPDHIEGVVVGCITGIVALGMKLLEGE